MKISSRFHALPSLPAAVAAALCLAAAAAAKTAPHKITIQR